MKVTLFLAARGLPLSGSSLKVKVSPPEGSEDSVDLGETERQDGTNPTYAKVRGFRYPSAAGLLKQYFLAFSGRTVESVICHAFAHD